MSSPEQRIAALEVELAELTEERNNATTEAMQLALLNAKNAKQNTLNLLLDAQAAAAGNAPPVTHFILCHP
jgi:hypothetical protein